MACAQGGYPDNGVVARNALYIDRSMNDCEMQTDNPNIVCSDILCYISHKIDIMVHDTLVKLCADHFNSADIESAKQIVYEWPTVRKLGLRQGRRRQGGNKDRANIEDIVMALHKCHIGLPTFAATNLAALPPLDTNNVDFSYIISEFRAMRAEMSSLRQEMLSMRATARPDPVEWPKPAGNQLTARDLQPLQIRLPELPVHATRTSAAAVMCPEDNSSESVISSSRPTNAIARPTLATVSRPDVRRNRSPDRPKTQRHARREDTDDGFTLVEAKNNKKKKSKKTNAVIGTRDGPNELKTVDGRFVCVFVSRLSPSVTEEEVIRYVKSVHNLTAKCVKLNTRYDNYTSFKVEANCKSVDEFYAPENWPAGVYVRKFFNPKNQHEHT